MSLHISSIDVTRLFRLAPGLCGGFVATLFWTSAALADSTNLAAPSPAATPNSATPAAQPSQSLDQPVDANATQAKPNAASSSALFGSLPQDPNLFGDMWGLRPALKTFGTTLTLQEQSEILGNVTGGRRLGFAYDGLTTATLQTDTQAAFGWNGGLFNVSGLQIHGRNLSTDNLLTLQPASNIEADPATRLWELWYQQTMFGGALDVKVGQQSIDQEFMLSQNAGVFLNAAMGWPMTPTADMPAGGPVYPLSALGVRVRAHPSDSWTMLAGVFNGSPIFSNYGDPQMRNPNGLSFPLNGGVLAIAELQYSNSEQGSTAKSGEPAPLAGVYKIGFWYDSENFADLRYDSAGLPLADPASSGIAATHRGNYAFYAMADQMIYRFENDADRNINLIIRPSFTPLRDRNLISFSLNGGLTMYEPFVGRPKDVFGIGFGYAQVSNSASGFNQDTAFFNPGVYTPVRRSETFIETTYQYQAAPWWQIQPDLQYVFNPGAGIVNPDNPTQKVKNEAVIGVRTTITF
jgi:porin